MTIEIVDSQTPGYGTRSVQWIMLQVMLALLPGTALYFALINHRILFNLIVAIVCALAVEALLLLLRKRPVIRTIKDGSIALAAWLLVLCLPPNLPAWQLVAGIFIMCALGKHVFGGLGNNPFNPAMVAYAALLISFPVSMTQWQDSSTSQVTELEVRWDSITGATSLDKIRNIKRAADRGTPPVITRSDVSNYLLSSHWFWINICWLLGGLYLLARHIISWHIPLSVLTSVSVLYSLQSFLIDSTLLGPLPALFSGALLLGAFFIATDPVSAAASIPGKLVYGAGIGILCFVIREYSIYPEGFAFAVLLMNICVPLLDQMFKRA